MLLDRRRDVAQQRIASRVTLAVVDLLEPVDVDVGENQMPVSVARAVDVALDQQQSDLASKRAGELIKLRASQVSSPQAVIPVRASASFDRRLAIVGRVRTVSGAFGPVDGPLIGCRLVEAVVRDGFVSVRRSTVSVLGRLISVRASLRGRCLRLIAIGDIILAIIR